MLSASHVVSTDFLVLQNRKLTVRVASKGGAVVDGRTSDGRYFLRPYIGGEREFTALLGACFPLVPIGNRVDGNEFQFAGMHRVLSPNTKENLYLHGDGWLGDWEVLEKSPETVTLRFAKHASESSPYEYQAIQTFRLCENSLDIDLSVTNSGDDILPFGIGFHPFFLRTTDTTLEVAATDWWTETPTHLPWMRESLPAEMIFTPPQPIPERWINNAFEGWDGEANINWPEQNLSLCLKATEVFSRFVLFAPQADQSYFCFEPMSHTPNALASAETDLMGLKLLAPGDEMSGGLSLAVLDGSEVA